MKILLVEDDANFRSLYQEVLTTAGFVIDTASDGNEGLTKAQEGGFDLILLDVMLPKMDGLSLLAELKKNPPKIPNGKIVLLTNLAHDPALKEAYDLGANSAILKTDLNPDQLVEKVKRLLGA